MASHEGVTFVVQIAKLYSLIRSLFISLCLIASFQAEAFHIVGGEMTYEYQGNDNYLITLRVYRDCFSQGAPFDAVASVGIFDGNGNLIQTQFFENPSISVVNTDVDFECDQISAQACVEQGIYQEIINLPPNDIGYYVAYQRCCRNNTILNLTTPSDWGATYQIFIPAENVAIGNSAPDFITFPPVGLCLDIPFALDQSAVDIDGDSLAYSFITPYHGGGSNLGLPPGDPDGPAPNPPTGPPWDNIQWAPGFNETNQITADPDFVYDPETGLLTGTPTQLGQFVIGLAVREYRDGVLLSEVRRDFQFNVVICPNVVQSSFSDINDGLYCDELTIQFENESVNGSFFEWNFGDGLVSFEESPSHTYAGPGIYEVSLISDPGGICSDTSFATISIAENPEMNILDPILNCPEENYTVPIEGDLVDVVSYDWQLNPGQEAPVTNQATLDDLVFTTIGAQVLTLEVTDAIGCVFQDDYIFNHPLFPVAGIEPIIDSCIGLSLQFESTSDWEQFLSWDFGDPGNPLGSTSSTPTHQFSTAGEYTVSLTASAPNTCPDVATMVVQANPSPEVTVLPQDPQCFEGNAFFFEAIGDFTPTSTFDWSFENGDVANSTAQVPGLVSFIEPGEHAVEVTITDGPCSSSDFVFPWVVEELDVFFLTEGTGCAPYTARFIDQSTGGAALNYSWDFGDGQGSQAIGTVEHIYDQPGQYQVSVTVQSTIGCLGEETFSFGEPITVFSSPQAGFDMEPPFADINTPFLELTSEALLADECSYIVDGFGVLPGCDMSLEFPDGGQYEITQVVRTESGCEDRFTRYFTVNGHVFYAPNAITMNNDGVNDFFRASVRGNIVEYELQIFDRWGGVLFETQDPDEYWVPEYGEVGMHSYRARVRDSFNTGEIYTGTFVVIR